MFKTEVEEKKRSLYAIFNLDGNVLSKDSNKEIVSNSLLEIGDVKNMTCHALLLKSI